MCIVLNRSLTTTTTTTSPAKWQYFLDSPMDGMQVGWHDYDSKPSARLEEEHHSRPSGSPVRRSVWHLKSGYFSYEVNLGTMTQRNTSTGRVRIIRRHEETGAAVPTILATTDHAIRASNPSTPTITSPHKSQKATAKKGRVVVMKRKLRSSPLRSFPKRRFTLVRSNIF